MPNSKFVLFFVIVIGLCACSYELSNYEDDSSSERSEGDPSYEDSSSESSANDSPESEIISCSYANIAGIGISDECVEAYRNSTYGDILESKCSYTGYGGGVLGTGCSSNYSILCNHNGFNFYSYSDQGSVYGCNDNVYKGYTLFFEDDSETSTEDFYDEGGYASTMVSCQYTDISGIGMKEECLEAPRNTEFGSIIEAECLSAGYGGGSLGSGCSSSYNIYCDYDGFSFYNYNEVYGSTCKDFYNRGFAINFGYETESTVDTTEESTEDSSHEADIESGVLSCYYTYILEIGMRDECIEVSSNSADADFLKAQCSSLGYGGGTLGTGCYSGYSLQCQYTDFNLYIYGSYAGNECD